MNNIENNDLIHIKHKLRKYYNKLESNPTKKDFYERKIKYYMKLLEGGGKVTVTVAPTIGAGSHLIINNYNLYNYGSGVNIYLYGATDAASKTVTGITECLIHNCSLATFTIHPDGKLYKDLYYVPVSLKKNITSLEYCDIYYPGFSDPDEEFYDSTIARTSSCRYYNISNNIILNTDYLEKILENPYYETYKESIFNRVFIDNLLYYRQDINNQFKNIIKDGKIVPSKIKVLLKKYPKLKFKILNKSIVDEIIRSIQEKITKNPRDPQSKFIKVFTFSDKIHIYITEIKYEKNILRDPQIYIRLEFRKNGIVIGRDFLNLKQFINKYSNYINPKVHIDKYNKEHKGHHLEPVSQYFPIDLLKWKQFDNISTIHSQIPIRPTVSEPIQASESNVTPSGLPSTWATRRPAPSPPSGVAPVARRPVLSLLEEIPIYPKFNHDSNKCVKLGDSKYKIISKDKDGYPIYKNMVYGNVIYPNSTSILLKKLGELIIEPCNSSVTTV